MFGGVSQTWERKFKTRSLWRSKEEVVDKPRRSCLEASWEEIPSNVDTFLSKEHARLHPSKMPEAKIYFEATRRRCSSRGIRNTNIVNEQLLRERSVIVTRIRVNKDHRTVYSQYSIQNSLVKKGQLLQFLSTFVTVIEQCLWRDFLWTVWVWGEAVS